MTLEDSADEKVRTAGVEIKTGREWSAAKAVTEAESRLKHKDIIGTAAVGRQGFSTSKNLLLGECKHSEETKFGPREIKMREKENRQAKTVDLGIRGAWLISFVPRAFVFAVSSACPPHSATLYDKQGILLENLF